MIYILAMILITLTVIGFICYHYLNKLVKLTKLGNTIKGMIELLSAVEKLTSEVRERDEVLKQSSLLGDTVLHVNTEIRDELLRQGKTKAG